MIIVSIVLVIVNPSRLKPAKKNKINKVRFCDETRLNDIVSGQKQRSQKKT